MAETSTTDNTNVSFSGTPEEQLLAYKKLLNETMETLFPGQGLKINETADPNDASFLYLLDGYVLNQAAIDLTPGLQPLVESYNNLPKSMQPRNTEPTVEQTLEAAPLVMAPDLDTLNASDRALVEFKMEVNKVFDAAYPDSGLKIHESTDAIDASLHYLLDNYILNEEQQARSPELKALAQAYNQLPQDVKETIDTQRTYFNRPNGTDAKRAQADAVVTLTQNYLDMPQNAATSDDGNLLVNEGTAKAIRDQLQGMEGEVDVEFEPRQFDQRSVDFLNAVVQKRMADANVKPEDLNTTLIHLWAMENNGTANVEGYGDSAIGRLGEAASLLNMMKLMVRAELPSGATTAQVEVDAKWDKQWTNNDSHDRFFSYDTYFALNSDAKTVTTDVLFKPSGYDQEQYDLLNRIADELEIDRTPGREMSHDEIGQIAIEMMSYKAQEAWCMINPDEPFDERQINTMIHEGRFMPHMDDLYLVDQGFGFPDSVQSWQNSPSERYGVQFTMEHGRDIMIHRGEAFVDRFGDMPREALERKMAGFPGESRENAEKISRDEFQSPANYFATARFMTGDQTPTSYELRRDEYLKEYQTFKEDTGSCLPKTGPSNDAENTNANGDCTVESVLKGNCDQTGTDTPQSTTPNTGESSDCTVESVLKSGCGDDFNQSAPNDISADDAIKSNAQDTTGNEQGDCSVESEIDRRLENGDIAPCVKN